MESRRTLKNASRRSLKPEDSPPKRSAVMRGFRGLALKSEIPTSDSRPWDKETVLSPPQERARFSVGRAVTDDACDGSSYLARTRARVTGIRE